MMLSSLLTGMPRHGKSPGCMEDMRRWFPRAAKRREKSAGAASGSCGVRRERKRLFEMQMHSLAIQGMALVFRRNRASGGATSTFPPAERENLLSFLLLFSIFSRGNFNKTLYYVRSTGF